MVIHPEDYSTNFLKAIYEGKGFDVYNDPDLEDYEVLDLMKHYDRIICLGHGSPGGLFGMYGHVVSNIHAHLMKEKELICIWCNADQFMKRYNLIGFYSGMFISEIVEATACGIHNVSQRQVDESNNLFAKLLGKYLDDEDRYEKIKREYAIEGSEVVKYNNARLYDTDMIKYFCDGCGREIKSLNCLNNIEYPVRLDTGKTTELDNRKETEQLCGECYDKVMKAALMELRKK